MLKSLVILDLNNMNRIKRLLASLFIPRNTNRCHAGFRFIKGKISGPRVCPFLTEKRGWEYCRLLHKELDVQMQVKECKINVRKHN